MKLSKAYLTKGMKVEGKERDPSPTPQKRYIQVVGGPYRGASIPLWSDLQRRPQTATLSIV